MKQVCEKCGKKKRVRHVVYFKGKYLCSDCKPKLNIGSHKGYISLEQALSRVYEVKGYIDKRNHVQQKLNVPSILIGHRIKLVLVD